jgi:Flp pilus assembly protein TadB
MAFSCGFVPGMRPPPDLDDPEQLRAYKAELRGLLRPFRYFTFGLALLACALILILAWVMPLPLWLPVGTAALWLMCTVTIVTARTRYHKLRMRGGE